MSHHFILFTVIGAVCGVLARLMTRGRGAGALSNIIIGVVGSLLGASVSVPQLDMATYGFRVSVLMAVLGAALALMIYHVMVDRPRRFHPTPGPRNLDL